MPAPKSVTVKFTKEKDTKNTVRYAEVPANEGDDLVLRTCYVSKPKAAELGNPESLTVTIKAG